MVVVTGTLLKIVRGLYTEVGHLLLLFFFGIKLFLPRKVSKVIVHLFVLPTHNESLLGAGNCAKCWHTDAGGIGHL